MNKQILIGGGILACALFGLAAWHSNSYRSAISSNTPVPQAAPTTSLVEPSPSPTASIVSVSPSPMASAATPSTMPAALPTVAKVRYVYPIANYTSRKTNRWYGKYITPADSKALPCGAPFTGYHTGDDLETTPAEQNQAVPVYAAASGTITQANHVNGYGGLIVEEAKLNGQTVTLYYGHISLNQSHAQKGTAVKAGQQIAVLGQACSAETDGERKHLHFAIHKGTTIDVRGYVPTEQALTSWLNPSTTLRSLDAK